MAKMGRPGLPEQTRQQVKNLWREGFSYTEISGITAAPPGSIYTILKPTGGIHTLAPKQKPAALTFKEREEISRGVATGQSIREISRQLKRAPSTISREIKRNGGVAKYRAVDAQDRAFYKSKRPQKMKLAANPLLHEHVLANLKKYWSPEQISNRLFIDYPDNSSMRISGEAIYRSIYLNYVHKLFPNKIHQKLRQKKPIRQSKNNTVRGQWRSQIKNANSIRERPAAAEHRLKIGHYEGDLILGSKLSQMATLVDRKTRVTRVIKLPDRRAETLTGHLFEYFLKHSNIPFESLTWDRGMELASHEKYLHKSG